jgi:hypothetical protein
LLQSSQKPAVKDVVQPPLTALAEKEDVQVPFGMTEDEERELAELMDSD